MSEVISGAMLANGLLNDFSDTYSGVRNRQKDSRLGLVMDLSKNATNRQHEYAYYEAAPHMTFWRRGDTVPQDAMDSVQFTAVVHEWARRIGWHKNDRKDDQTQSLNESARQVGASAGLLPERYFFDLITNSATTLPAVPSAPDGAVMFATTDGGGGNRFGVSSGNLLTGNGVASASAIRTDYYNAIEQWKQFQDGKGQPLIPEEMVDAGVLVIHSAADTEAFEEAFLQKRQGEVMGTDAGTTPSNLVQDASRTTRLWGSSRLATGDWYAFLLNPPKKPTFLLNREGLQEFTAFEGDNNSDHVRDTGSEYVQWEIREGAGIALPFGAIKVNN